MRRQIVEFGDGTLTDELNGVQALRLGGIGLTLRELFVVGGFEMPIPPAVDR